MNGAFMTYWAEIQPTKTETVSNQCIKCGTTFIGYVDFFYVIFNFSNDISPKYGPYCRECLKKGISIPYEIRS